MVGYEVNSQRPIDILGSRLYSWDAGGPYCVSRHPTTVWGEDVVDVSMMWQREIDETFVEPIDPRYNVKTMVVMDRLVHIGSGSGTFGVSRGRRQDDGVTAVDFSKPLEANPRAAKPLRANRAAGEPRATERHGRWTVRARVTSLWRRVAGVLLRRGHHVGAKHVG